MRYIVTKPVEGGYAFWNVADTQSEIMPNFAVATFSVHMPNAGREAYDLCEKLNRK